MRRHQQRLRQALAAMGVTVIASLTLAPAVTANSYPGWANSHYMSPVTSSYMFDRGCDYGAGTKYQGGGLTNYAVVLDFGPARASGSTQGAYPWNAGSHTFESTTWVADKVEQFGLGFYSCSSSVPFLTVMAGVTNDTSTYLTTTHGAAWANMIDTVNTWMSTSPHNIASQVMAMGAIDAEAGFAAPATTVRAWVNAYSTASDTSFVYDFGDAPCSNAYAIYKAAPGYKCSGASGCTHAQAGCWFQDDFYWISMGCDDCLGMPEIYNDLDITMPNGKVTDHNAQEWIGIVKYGYYEGTGFFYWPTSSTTQHTACHQPGHSCSGTDNTQSDGWNHLHNALSYYAPTETELPWENEFMWGW